MAHVSHVWTCFGMFHWVLCIVASCAGTKWLIFSISHDTLHDVVSASSETTCKKRIGEFRIPECDVFVSVKPLLRYKSEFQQKYRTVYGKSFISSWQSIYCQNFSSSRGGGHTVTMNVQSMNMNELCKRTCSSIFHERIDVFMSRDIFTNERMNMYVKIDVWTFKNDLNERNLSIIRKVFFSNFIDLKTLFSDDSNEISGPAI